MQSSSRGVREKFSPFFFFPDCTYIHIENQIGTRNISASRPHHKKLIFKRGNSYLDREVGRRFLQWIGLVTTSSTRSSTGHHSSSTRSGAGIVSFEKETDFPYRNR